MNPVMSHSIPIVSRNNYSEWTLVLTSNQAVLFSPRQRAILHQQVIIMQKESP